MQLQQRLSNGLLLIILFVLSVFFISCASSQKRELHEMTYEKVVKNLTTPTTQEVPSDASNVKMATVKSIQFHLDFTDLLDLSYYMVKNPETKQGIFATSLVGKGQIETMGEDNKEKRRKSSQLFIQLNVVSSDKVEDAYYTALVKSCVDLASQIQNSRAEKRLMDLVLTGEIDVDLMSNSFQFTVSDPKIKTVHCSVGKE